MGEAITRRGFISVAAGAVAARRASGAAPGGTGPTVVAAGQDRPALLGGTPVRGTPFPSWPVVDEREEKALADVLFGHTHAEPFHLPGETSGVIINGEVD